MSDAEAVYHEKARFVLKILPDMDRNKVAFEERVDDAKRRAQPKRKMATVDSAGLFQAGEGDSHLLSRGRK